MSVPTTRLLIPDLGVGDEQVFTDDQIEAFLDLSENDPRAAAAQALEVIATDEALVFKVTRNDDHSVDGVAGARVLLERAARLRNEAWGGAFEVHYARPYPRVPEATARPWR